MTAHQHALLKEAKEYWDIGMQIPLTLYADMATQGMDVPSLEAKYINN